MTTPQTTTIIPHPVVVAARHVRARPRLRRRPLPPARPGGSRAPVTARTPRRPLAQGPPLPMTLLRATCGPPRWGSTHRRPVSKGTPLTSMVSGTPPEAWSSMPCRPMTALRATSAPLSRRPPRKPIASGLQAAVSPMPVPMMAFFRVTCAVAGPFPTMLRAARSRISPPPCPAGATSPWRPPPALGGVAHGFWSSSLVWMARAPLRAALALLLPLQRRRRCGARVPGTARTWMISPPRRRRRGC